MRTLPGLAPALLALLAPALAAWGPPPAPPPKPGAGELRDVLGDPAFPDASWEASTPAAEGMDPAPLAAGVAAIGDRRLAIHSFLVIRHGKLVLERYGKDQGRQLGPEDLHELHSVTKTFTGALVGLAIADGKIPSVRARALGWFPGDAVADRSAEKAQMTIEDLLTMRSGLEYEELTDERLFQTRPCAAEAILSQPVLDNPGVRWSYSSGNSQILAEIVRRATGKIPQETAVERLFTPLGITRYRWGADQGGTTLGGWGLWLRPRDLARFGLVLLNHGRWQGTQVLPARWVTEMMKRRTSTSRPGNGYGYQGWIPEFGGFALRGYLGQEVFVLPAQDLVVVFTADLPPHLADVLADELVRDYVLPAVKM